MKKTEVFQIDDLLEQLDAGADPEILGPAAERLIGDINPKVVSQEVGTYDFLDQADAPLSAPLSETLSDDGEEAVTPPGTTSPSSPTWRRPR